jgi:hypothetical protein
MKKTDRCNRTRRGMAALEAVLTAAIALPMAAFVFWLLARMLERFFYLIGTVVGSPYV